MELVPSVCGYALLSVSKGCMLFLILRDQMGGDKRGILGRGP